MDVDALVACAVAAGLVVVVAVAATMAVAVAVAVGEGTLWPIMAHDTGVEVMLVLVVWPLGVELVVEPERVYVFVSECMYVYVWYNVRFLEVELVAEPERTYVFVC